MMHVCPKCGREFELDLSYCAACGAPMKTSTVRSEFNKRVNNANPALLPMAWHKFLKWFSIPVSIVVLIVGLIRDIPLISQFDPSLYFEEMLPLVRLSLYADVGSSVISLAVLGCAEYLMIKNRWTGVKLVLFNYLFQAVYGAFNLLLFFLSPRSLDVNIASMIISVAEMALMFVLNRVYYRKRRARFQPYPNREDAD